MNTDERIWVIDREPGWRDFVSVVLRGAGYSTALLGGLSTIPDDVDENHVQLILADAALRDLLASLAGDHRHFRFVIFSAMPSVDEMLAAFRAGALDYCSKSFQPRELLAAVTLALQKQPVSMPRFSPE